MTAGMASIFYAGPWKAFILSLLLNDSLAGCKILAWKLFFLWTLKIWLSSLLVFVGIDASLIAMDL